MAVQTMMKKTLCALLLITAQASADTPAPLLDLATAAKGLWIGTSQPKGEPPFLNVAMVSREYTGSATLELDLELPDGQSPSDVVYLFDGKPIGDFVYRYGDRFTVYLPPMNAHGIHTFSIGLPDAPLAYSRATALLSTDQGEKSTSWVGWMLRHVQ